MDHTDQDDGAFPRAGHDHRACIRRALGAAGELCGKRGARLTALRSRVLALVWESHAPIGAYQLLDKLARGGRRAAPPTVYRALEFLAEHGLVHRIESLNAYVGCNEPGAPHSCQFLICRGCGAAAELADERVSAAVGASCGAAGFEVQRVTLEVLGLCPACRAAGAGA